MAISESAYRHYLFLTHGFSLQVTDDCHVQDTFIS